MGQFSPDTHWIAYASDESGRSEIYVQPFPYLREAVARLRYLVTVEPALAGGGMARNYSIYPSTES